MTPKVRTKAAARNKDMQRLGRIYTPDKNKNWSIFQLLSFSTVVGIVSYFLYYGYLETRINTPLSVPKMVSKLGIEDPERYWGTYRPGVYFGTKVRHPVSPITGLMWFVQNHYQNNMPAFRHWCEQGDDVEQFGWKVHDGRNYGHQVIKDKKVHIETTFVKRVWGKYGGDWSARVKVIPKVKRMNMEVSLFYYVALNPTDDQSYLKQISGIADSLGSLQGNSEALGDFRLHLLKNEGNIKRKYYLSTKHDGFDKLKESVFKGLRLYENDNNSFIGLGGDVFSVEDKDNNPTLLVFQVSAVPPFEIEVVFQSMYNVQMLSNMLSGQVLSDEIKKYSQKFDEDFEEKFNLKEKEFSNSNIEFAKACLSNMIGSIGYFYGTSKVQGKTTTEPVPYWKAPLYTGVPSRSFFPRGFLWDEGFHNLLISKWDREISMDILAHWFDLMNWDGWIPREQILGVEARARVPDEFVTQHETAANPPTLILTLHSMLTHFQQSLSDNDYNYLNKLWPRLKAWYNWFNTTQLGSLPGTYRWRGRDSKTNKELNPKTLTSGLDDYPRSSHPTEQERHLDLRCWMTLASGLMAEFAQILEKDATKYVESHRYLSNNDVLDSLHWSYFANGYMDYGLHTDSVSLKRLNPKSDKVRVVKSEPQLKFVDSFGYVSFFPLFLQIINSNSVKLRKVLEDLKKPELLWTNYGLRSLAYDSPFYNKFNSEHDPPYWRGSIWINMNFLAVRSLNYYSKIQGPNQQLAKDIYNELRKNLLNNIIKVYNETGYIWEHYNDKTGKGEGCRPFTGWTALVVLIMGETY